jgi:hypothetical protein
MHKNAYRDFPRTRERKAFLVGCDAGMETMRTAVLGRILKATGEAITRGEGRVVSVLDDLANEIENSWRQK